VDAVTGVILRQQQFEGGDSNTLLAESIITTIYYDIKFPDPSIFDPTSPLPKNFLVDYAGEPVPVTITARSFIRPPASGHKPLPHKLPPPDFNPASYPLTFQYPLGSSFQTAWPISVSLFAGEYYLGEIPMGNPWESRCKRSRDGRLVAIFTPKQQSQNFWFDLSNPEKRRSIQRNLDIFDFAFAPDSRWLAFQGYRQSTGESGIYLLDTETGELGLLREMMSASSLVWSPDGKHLALLGSNNPGFPYEAMIIDAGTGEITHRSAVDPIPLILGSNFPQNWPSPDFPANAWNVQFPDNHFGLGDCTAIPEVEAR
jgi:hypothetical protein